MKKIYRTVKQAHSALCLDFGFDPFLHLGERVTKKNLARFGYIVDRNLAKSKRTTCLECGTKLELEWNGSDYVYPKHCPEHRKYMYSCDNGHRWYRTREEDQKAEHKCPECGNYWV